MVAFKKNGLAIFLKELNSDGEIVALSPKDKNKIEKINLSDFQKSSLTS